MPNADPNVVLAPDMAALVREAVESGGYATETEVVEEALREWRLRHALSPRERDTLRALWTEGRAGGPGRLGSIAAIKREARLQSRSTGTGS